MRFWRHGKEETADSELRLIVGLGNPGEKYARTRHNAGYMVAETLAQRHGIRFGKSKHRAEVGRGTINGVPVLLALPLTYMNESGNAVSRLVHYYRVPLDRLLVMCDEIDLPFGTLRLRPSGSSAGHRGLQSIIQALGTDAFARLRVGVGRPPGEGVHHVLGPFSADEARLVPALIDTAADAVTVALVQGMEVAMNRYNRDWLPTISPSAIGGEG